MLQHGVWHSNYPPVKEDRYRYDYTVFLPNNQVVSCFRTTQLLEELRMIKKDQIFELQLEDYAVPRYMSVPKHYYGTMDEMINMLIRVEENPYTATRYKETLDAAEYYDLDNELTHTVAGQTFPIFTPVRELSRLETQLGSQTWNYTAFNGVSFPCYANNITVRQTLIQTPTGYEHCVQADLSSLRVCYPGIGWKDVAFSICGFPEMVTYDNGIHSMSLATSQAHYEPNELQKAMADATNPMSVDLSCLVADILAEG